MKKTIPIILILLVSIIFIGHAQNNAPISTVGNPATSLTTVTVPITAINFSNIGSCNLQLNYDPSIATATSVSIGPGIGGGISTNLSTPGVIRFGWYKYPAATLPDGSVIFNINFTKVTSGTTAITWDSTYTDREWSNGSYQVMNDLPLEDYYFAGSLTFLPDNAPITSLPNVSACAGANIDVPVTVSDFDNIGAFNLTLHYNSGALGYQAFSNNSSFPGLTVTQANPGEIVASGTSSLTNGISLDDDVALFTLHFEVLGESSDLTWFDDGTSCQYNGPAPGYAALYDLPQATFYIDGSFNASPLPGTAGEISGPAGGNVCQGQNGVIFSVPAIENATSYNWILPEGATITDGSGTNLITVDFGSNAVSGDVFVYGENECGSGEPSPAFLLSVNSAPEITQQPITPGIVNAGDGVATFEVMASGSSLSYQWQEFITSWENINDGGVYSGVNTAVLNITDPPAGMNGYFYRCIVTGLCEPPAITDGLAQLIIQTTPCMAFELPFIEDFEGLPEGGIPECWSVEEGSNGSWGVSLSNIAGGESPEMKLGITPLFDESFMLISPEINTAELAVIVIEFRHALNFSESPGQEYTIGLKTTSDGVIWNKVWSITPMADIAAETVQIAVSNNDVSSGQFRFAFFFDGYVTDHSSWWLDDISVFEATPDVPENLSLNGFDITSLESGCFSATKTINVSDFTIVAGGSVELVAGEKITLGAGTVVEPGAYLLAHISDTWCSLPSSMLTNPKNEAIVAENSKALFGEKPFAAYPNPTKGTFFIELQNNNEVSGSTVEIYDMVGELIQRHQVVGKETTINLSDSPPGIYIIRVHCGEKMDTGKVVRY